MKIKGDLTAAIYAPDHEIEMKPGHGAGNFYGSIVGNKFKIEGEEGVHYDESLENQGPITGYQIVSWLEDWVPKGRVLK